MHSIAVNISLLLATMYYVYATDDHHKRAPSGFTGVRGKKSIPDSAYSETGADNSEALSSLKGLDLASDVNLMEKRAPSGFMGMRGKKPFSYVPWEGTYPDGLLKRAPSGFMGMRGKKDAEISGYDEHFKRAPSGFFGMRGKKDFSDQFDSSIYEKRAMGFMGMRGKKDDDLLDLGEKRAPSGFFGMRGKKQPSGFFGMRGKKYPYEFRGKFVGVRGKKVSNEVIGPDYYNYVSPVSGYMGRDLDLNQLMLLLTEQNEAENRNGVWNVQNDGHYDQ